MKLHHVLVPPSFQKIHMLGASDFRVFEIDIIEIAVFYSLIAAPKLPSETGHTIQILLVSISLRALKLAKTISGMENSTFGMRTY
jgi:hypothetical protein